MKIVLNEKLVSEDAAYPKLLELKRLLAGKSVVVSFSGGVDSTFLALVAKTYSSRALAVTADSPTLAPGELERARGLAGSIGIPHRIVRYDELEDPDFARNPENRCYYCKKGLIGNLKQIALKEGYDLVLEGTNASDVRGHRPGRGAVLECGAISPLHDAGITKEEIRRLSHSLGLPTWDKPSMPCLASRVPYGTRITHERLERIGKAEEVLRELGFATVRVRDHGEVARIEVAKQKVADLVAPQVAETVTKRLKDLGFTHVAVDLLGYRTGSMNEGFWQPERAQAS